MNHSALRRPYIAWVEDDPDDRELVYEIFSRLNWAENIIIFESGDQLFKYLSKIESEDHLPSIIVSDQHFPRHDSEYILQGISKEEEWQSIPVCILSSSLPKAKEKKLLFLGASCCKTKPSSVEETMNMMKEYIEYAKAGKCLNKKKI